MASSAAPVRLFKSDTPEWKLWSLVAELSKQLRPDQWVLVGGQMVALHLHTAALIPTRTTTDVDVVADVLAERGSFAACRHAAAALSLEAQPSITGKTLHRFVGPAGQLDLMVADHLPSNLVRQFTKPFPVAIDGGQRALDRRITVAIATESGTATVPIPDLAGALVLKARAAISDTRDRERHHLDIAQLCAIIDDPIGFLERIDAKEKRHLRRVQLNAELTTFPWLDLDSRIRRRAHGAWLALMG